MVLSVKRLRSTAWTSLRDVITLNTDLDSTEVTLQAVTYQNGFIGEETEKYGLNVPQRRYHPEYWPWQHRGHSPSCDQSEWFYLWRDWEERLERPSETLSWILTLTAQRSLSKLWPIRMVLSVKRLRSTAWTSLREVITPNTDLNSTEVTLQAVTNQNGFIGEETEKYGLRL